MDTGNLPWAYNLDEFYKFDFVDKRIDFMYIFHAFCKYCNINTDNIQGVVLMKADANLDFCNLYLSWIKQNIDQFKVSDNTFRLTMPFLDRNNDQIEIYITKAMEVI